MTALNLDVEIGASGGASSELTLLHQNFKHVLTAVRFGKCFMLPLTSHWSCADSMAPMRSLIGNEAYYGGDLHKALQNYEAAEELMKTMGNQRGLGVCQNNKGNVLKVLGKSADAERLFKLSIENAKRLQDGIADKTDLQKTRAANVVHANRLMNLGVLYKDTNRADLALQYFDASMALHRQADNSVGVTKVSVNIAQVDRSVLRFIIWAFARSVTDTAALFFPASNCSKAIQRGRTDVGWPLGVGHRDRR